MMQSVEKHQEVPREEAAVTPVKGLKKRRRVRNLAAERRQRKQELTRGNCGSACRKRCPAMQEWHGGKGNSFGKFGIR
jgi:hypothetical protein